MTERALFARGAGVLPAPRANRRRRRRSLTASVAAAGVLLLGAGVQVAAAAFTATTSSPGNQFTAAAAFPTYPTSVTTSAPWAYHRGEDTPSAAATSTAADSSGNARPGTYHGATDGPATWWKADEGAGTTAADSSGAANPGTLSAAAGRAAGRSGNAFALTGDAATSYVQGAGRAVRTDRDFTVMAWVFLSATGQNRAVVSQDGAVQTGFALQYSMSGSGRWEFVFVSSDDWAPTIEYASAAAPPALNTWTHLAGVYDDAANQIRLYVNGVLDGTAARVADFDATGRLQVGRSHFWGGYNDPWAGRVDDVRAYPRALTVAQVAAIAAPSGLRYDFNENAGPTTADASGSGNTGTLAGGASWRAAGKAGAAVELNGTTSYVSSAGPAGRTDQSYTVAAWVNLDTLGTVRTVVSQSGTFASSFQLDYNGWTWRFGVSWGDVNGSGFVYVHAGAGAVAGQWTHVAGVYDVGAGELYLYVDGVYQGSGAMGWPFHASGPLRIGTALVDGSLSQFFDGAIDQAVFYQRALTGAEIVNLRDGVGTGTTPASMTVGIPGALQGPDQGLAGSTAVAFGGTANASNNLAVANPGPQAFTIECWFRVSPGYGGGALVGFATDRTGTASAQYDRVLYLDTAGKLRFGVNPLGGANQVTVVSPSSYHDGAWHHVAASLGPAGMRLYVDGLPVANAPGTTAALAFTGYWRFGGAALSGFPAAPANPYLLGSLDEVAIYNGQLTDQQIAWHYHADY